MGNPLSYDLRKKIIEKYEEIKVVSIISDMFNVCRQTVYNLIKLKKETKDIKLKENYQKGI